MEGFEGLDEDDIRELIEEEILEVTDKYQDYIKNITIEWKTK